MLILCVARVISVISCRSGYDRIRFTAADFWLTSIGIQRNFKNSFFGSSMNKNKRPRENRSEFIVRDLEKHFQGISFQCLVMTHDASIDGKPCLRTCKKWRSS